MESRNIYTTNAEFRDKIGKNAEFLSVYLYLLHLHVFYIIIFLYEKIYHAKDTVDFLNHFFTVLDFHNYHFLFHLTLPYDIQSQ